MRKSATLIAVLVLAGTIAGARDGDRGNTGGQDAGNRLAQLPPDLRGTRSRDQGRNPAMLTRRPTCRTADPEGHGAGPAQVVPRRLQPP